MLTLYTLLIVSAIKLPVNIGFIGSIPEPGTRWRTEEAFVVDQEGHRKDIGPARLLATAYNQPSKLFMVDNDNSLACYRVDTTNAIRESIVSDLPMPGLNERFAISPVQKQVCVCGGRDGDGVKVINFGNGVTSFSKSLSQLRSKSSRVGSAISENSDVVYEPDGKHAYVALPSKHVLGDGRADPIIFRVATDGLEDFKCSGEGSPVACINSTLVRYSYPYLFCGKQVKMKLDQFISGNRIGNELFVFYHRGERKIMMRKLDDQFKIKGEYDITPYVEQGVDIIVAF